MIALVNAVFRCQSSILPFVWFLLSGASNLRNHAIPIVFLVKDSGLHYSLPLTFSKQAAYQIVGAKRTVDMESLCLELKHIKLLSHKNIVRHLPELGLPVGSGMLISATFTTGNIQHSFNKHLLGVSFVLSYNERCKPSQLDPLWLRRHGLNLSALYKIINCSLAGFSRTDFTETLPFPLRRRAFSLPSSNKSYI